MVVISIFVLTNPLLNVFNVPGFARNQNNSHKYFPMMRESNEGTSVLPMAWKVL